MKQLLVAFKDGKRVAEYPITDTTSTADIQVVLREWEELGRTWEYQINDRPCLGCGGIGYHKDSCKGGIK